MTRAEGDAQARYGANLVPLEELHAAGATLPLAVILLTRDQLLSHVVTTSCTVRNIV